MIISFFRRAVRHFIVCSFLALALGSSAFSQDNIFQTLPDIFVPVVEAEVPAVLAVVPEPGSVAVGGGAAAPAAGSESDPLVEAEVSAVVAEPEPELPSVPLVAISTDANYDSDDAATLAMAFAMHAAGEIRLVAVVSDDNVAAAQVADSFNQFWGTNVPIGMSQSGVWHGESSIQWNVLQHYNRRWDFEAADSLLARVIWENPDQVRLVSLGYLNVFADLLRNHPGAADRAQSFTVMGGDYWMVPGWGEFWDVNNFKNDTWSAEEVINNWPGTIQFVGHESGRALIGGEWGWRTAWNNPMRLALEAHGWTGRLRSNPWIHSPDPVALLFAVYPDGFAGAHRTESFGMGYSSWENRAWIDSDGSRGVALRVHDEYQVKMLIESWVYRQPF